MTWQKIAGSVRERLGVAAVAAGLVVATTVVSFAGCRKPPSVAANAAIFTVQTPLPPPSETQTKAVSPVKPPTSGTIIVYVTGAVKRPGVYTLAADARLYHAVRAAGGFKTNAVTEALNLADRAQDGDQLCIPARQKAAKPVVRVAAAPRTTPVFTGAIRRSSTLRIEREATLPVTVSLPLPAEPSDTEPPTVTVLPTPAPGRVLGAPAPVAVAMPEASGAEEIFAEAAPDVASITAPPATAPRPKRANAAKASSKFKNPGDGMVRINTATDAQFQQLSRCGPAMSAKIIAYRAQIGGRFTDLKQLMDVKGVGEKTFAKWQPFLAL